MIIKALLIFCLYIVICSFYFCTDIEANTLPNESTITNLHYEGEYVDSWCTGIIEAVMKDGTRCDCLTKYFAIEFDFGNKWYEGIMQALHYSEMTGKNPGLVLILKNKNQIKFYERALVIINKRNLPVNLWVIKTYKD